MKIIFETSPLSCQGTSVAINDYAFYNQEILNNESIILTKTNYSLNKINPTISHDPITIDFMKKKYKILYYNTWDEAEKLINENKCDLLYTLKAGIKDEIISKNVKTAVHAVFRCLEPHGTVNAFVSEWLSKNFLDGKYPFVPHIINLPNIDDDLRLELNIPKNAIVVGRHGSKTTFNLPFVFDVVNKIVTERNDIYFIFLNTNEFCEHFPNHRLIKHQRIIHLPTTFDPTHKTKFINTCDVMLHARSNGESFGIAVAEFSIKNKPVITWTGKNHQLYYRHGHDLAHIDMLGDKGIYYDNQEDLYYILKNFIIDKNKTWDAYSIKYNPKTVMEKFKNVFIN